MVKIILLLLCFRVDNDSTIVDTFDMMEVNHYHNEFGVEQWSQLICWDWNSHRKRFEVHHWIMMKDAYEKTEEGEKRWNSRVRDIADKIKNWEARRHFLDNSKYNGEFTGGALFPLKNYKSGYYEVIVYEKHNSANIRRKIQAKTFRKTRTMYDPEVEDRKVHHQDLRRGLAKIEKAKPIDIHWLNWQNVLKKTLSHQ